jgi:hypothetical protein
MKLINYRIEHPDTKILRVLAIILIINSHLDRYYPTPYIGTGGAIGNSIFFFLSAFGLYLSEQERKKEFTQWFAHRVSRIYPSLWIVLITLYMPAMVWKEKLNYSTIITFIGDFFNPPFWFLQYLLVYYLVTFYLLKNTRKANTFVFMGFLGLLYMAVYVSLVDLSRWSVEESPFDLIHYLMVFIFGIYIAKKNETIVYSGVSDYVFLFAIVGLFYAQKYLMLKGLYFEYQFLQQLAMYHILYYLLKISRSPLIKVKLMSLPALYKAIDFIAKNTLEIYMVHQTISSAVLSIQMQFPLNIIMFLLLTICLSTIINSLANTIRRKIL